MCRFVFYFSSKPVLLSSILDEPKNSLINQSREAREGRLGLNADGFGLGWYDHSIDETPGVFKSTQPAWNDVNLGHLISKIQSKCFVGHVRASTVGDVSSFNCHPFTYQNYMFVHNGTVRGFESFKRDLMCNLQQETFKIIKGQTDSEHFFSMLIDELTKNASADFLNDSLKAFYKSLDVLSKYQHDNNSENISRLNTVLTNGNEVFATRYSSGEDDQPLSLYYAYATHVHKNAFPKLISANTDNFDVIIISSEPLDDNLDCWHEVPANHALLINKLYDLKLIKL